MKQPKLSINVVRRLRPILTDITPISNRRAVDAAGVEEIVQIRAISRRHDYTSRSRVKGKANIHSVLVGEGGGGGTSNKVDIKTI